MPTNRKRIRRLPKSKIPKKISEEYRNHLKWKDFMGKLEDHEIPVAAKAGVLKWDLRKKAKRLKLPPYRKNWSIAPVFDGHGNIDPGRYDDKIRFFVKNYKELKGKQEKNG